MNKLTPTSNHTLPREERLRGRVVVSQLFAEGASGFIFPLRYVWIEEESAEDEIVMESEESEESEMSEVTEVAEGTDEVTKGTKQILNQILFTVPKRFHKRANKRNLLRRRVKEAYRLNKELLPVGTKGLRIALAYSNKEVLEFSQIERAVKRVLTQIAIESGRTENSRTESDSAESAQKNSNPEK